MDALAPQLKVFTAATAPLVAKFLLTIEPVGQQLDNLETFIFSHIDPTGAVRAPTNGWFLTDLRSAGYVAIGYLVAVFFFSFVMSFKFMPKLDPYPLKFCYNVSQIMMCSYMCVEAGVIAYRNGYSLMPCNEFDLVNPPVLNVLYLFYLSKLWDFWDTTFMILGKKWNQLTFLHVYHHFSIFLFYWLNTRVNYDGDIYLTIVLNGFIHTVMYTYYFVCMHTKVPTKWLSDPTVSKSCPIWWKSALTMNQMVQFCCMISQAVVLLKRECGMPHVKITQAYIGYVFTMLFLFMQFFISSYVTGGKKKGGKKGGKDKRA